MAYFEAAGAMHRLQLLRRIKARELMADSGLHPGQPPLLQFIWDHPGCTQKEAADELDVTPASTAASLKRLEKAGYVARQPDPKDARRNRLFITDEGVRQMRTCQERFCALDRAMFAGMTDEEVEHFRLTCERMFDSLADESCRHLTVCKLARQARRKEEESK